MQDKSPTVHAGPVRHFLLVSQVGLYMKLCLPIDLSFAHLPNKSLSGDQKMDGELEACLWILSNICWHCGLRRFF